MDGKLNDGRFGKLWMCSKEHGHVLGLVIEEQKHGVKFGKLVFFRHAVLAEALDEAKILGCSTNDVTLECDLCDAERTYYMDERLAQHVLAPLHESKEKEKV